MTAKEDENYTPFLNTYTSNAPLASQTLNHHLCHFPLFFFFYIYYILMPITTAMFIWLTLCKNVPRALDKRVLDNWGIIFYVISHWNHWYPMLCVSRKELDQPAYVLSLFIVFLLTCILKNPDKCKNWKVPMFAVHSWILVSCRYTTLNKHWSTLIQHDVIESMSV